MTANFTTAFADTNYVAAGFHNTTINTAGELSPGTINAGSFQVQLYDRSGTLIDSTVNFLVFFGDQ